MSNWEKTHAKRIRRFEGMDEAELLKRNIVAMLDLEIIWHVAEARLCEMAGDDRAGEPARMSAEAGEIFHSLKALHRKMDRLAASVNSTPVARSGAR